MMMMMMNEYDNDDDNVGWKDSEQKLWSSCASKQKHHQHFKQDTDGAVIAQLASWNFTNVLKAVT